MDLIGYTLNEEEIKAINQKVSQFQSSLLLDMAVLMDEGGRLISFAPYNDKLKPLAYRVAIIGAAVVGAVDQLENIISSKRSMFFSGAEKNMYVHMINNRFMFTSVFSQKVPLGTVKLMKERVSRELVQILEKAVGRGETQVVRFEDLAI